MRSKENIFFYSFADLLNEVASLSQWVLVMTRNKGRSCLVFPDVTLLPSFLALSVRSPQLGPTWKRQVPSFTAWWMKRSRLLSLSLLLLFKKITRIRKSLWKIRQLQVDIPNALGDVASEGYPPPPIQKKKSFIEGLGQNKGHTKRHHPGYTQTWSIGSLFYIVFSIVAKF